MGLDRVSVQLSSSLTVTMPIDQVAPLAVPPSYRLTNFQSCLFACEMQELLPKSHSGASGTEDGVRKQGVLLRYAAGIFIISALVLVSSAVLAQVVRKL
jgi:hypothetical protein